MDASEMMKRIRVKESIESQCKSFMEEKINRYLEIEHQGIIGGHYFAPASSECIYLYRDGYFIGAVMMSHAINEGLMKFVAERNSIERNKSDGTTKTVEDLVSELTEKCIISVACANASMRIWKSYRNDIHHMNPTVGKIDFKKLAQQNLKHLSTIEKEIFDFKNNNGVMVPTQPKYWEIRSDGTSPVFLRLD
ncbi:MAG: hypothetical protein DRH12_17955 [Deltaproteobacteria bacterium]|nr:MAG: hypothetical protein DRH12_17955 [Deltaproteobacteria bacterium]